MVGKIHQDKLYQSKTFIRLYNANDERYNEQISLLLPKSIIQKANETKKIQKKLNQEFKLLAIENFLHQGLAQEDTARPLRPRTIMGMRGGKIYVSVHGFGTDIKLYTDDLGGHYGCRYQVSDVSAIPKFKPAMGQSATKTTTRTVTPPSLHVGDSILLRTQRFDAGNRRFVLLPAG